MTIFETWKYKVPAAARDLFVQYAAKYNTDEGRTGTFIFSDDMGIMILIARALIANFSEDEIKQMLSLGTLKDMNFYFWKRNMSRIGDMQDDYCIIKYSVPLINYPPCMPYEVFELSEVAEGEDMPGILKFTIDGDYCTIVGWDRMLPKNLIIPEYLGYYKVSAIGAAAFSNNGAIQSVTLPKGIQEVRKGAFARCSNLKEVYLNGTLSVGEDAFPEGVIINN